MPTGWSRRRSGKPEGPSGPVGDLRSLRARVRFAGRWTPRATPPPSATCGRAERFQEMKTMNTRPATLRPGSRSGEMRHYLSGRPVNGGDTIELCFSGGWVTGRYEWNSEQSEQQPSFHCSIVVDGGGVVERVIEIPENALVRWP